MMKFWSVIIVSCVMLGEFYLNCCYTQSRVVNTGAIPSNSVDGNIFGLLLHPPKSDDKYAQKSVQLVRGSSFRSDFLQNPYFR